MIQSTSYIARRVKVVNKDIINDISIQNTQRYKQVTVST